jgi:cystathionine beta-lyase
VVINPPVYPPFFEQIAQAGFRLVEAPLAVEGGRYQLDLEALERAFRSGSRVYVLCNPHNPMGRVFSRAELLPLVDLAERYQVLVLSDEIHAPLTLPGARHVPYLSLGEAASARGIALVSASKGWNVPGLKCAQIVVASDPMRQVVKRLPDHVWFHAGNLGVIASSAAYRDGVAWLDELITVLDRNRKLFGRLLAERLPDVGYTAPEAGYLVWLDCRALRLPEEPADRFLERGRVALTPGLRFGRQGRGFARACIATSTAILTEMVDRMRAAVN